MKRILLASHNASLSGAPQVLYNIASHLDRSQFEPLVVFPENGPIIEKFKAAGLPVAVIDVGDSCWEKLHVPMIKALCKAKDISLVHANTIHSYPFVTAAKRSGIPCFLHVHEMLVSGWDFV